MSSNEISIRPLKCALGLPCVPDICQAINSTLDLKFTYIVAPLINPNFKREHITKGLKHQSKPLTRSDLLLATSSWQNWVVGKIWRFYNCDSEVESVRKNAQECLIEELKFTSHLNLSSLIIPLRSNKMENFCQILNSFILNKLIMFNITISIPLTTSNYNVDIRNLKESNDTTWHWWKKLRSLIEENSKMNVSLVLTPDLPASDEIERWFAEPVRSLTIPTSLFMTNKSGFPVLPRPHQLFVKRFFQLDVDIIIEGANRHSEKGTMSKYYEYMNYLYKSFQLENTDTSRKYIKGYEDCLQNPLQPLQDNLESTVYEVFEKDPIKYYQYQIAIQQALLDRVSESEKLTKETVIMVVGAGRGPLVKAAMKAAYEAERKIKLFAIEKNPNAINTLLNLNNDEWGNKVEIIASDMRDWKGTEKADILVSELLGSIGDNELSPECLDGAQSLLKEDGISIPYRYRSFIAPVQSYKIYSEVKRIKEYDHPYEAPYVVFLHNHCRIDEEKFLFEFLHPNKSEKIDNNRYGTVEFTAKHDATMHGIGGYFDSHLYKDVDISITPKTHSPGLFSWFPMFFPLKNPIDVKKNDKITVHFWRHVTPRQVHYEWCVTSPSISSIHNPNGRTYWIGQK